jgi:hypothetical protein
VCGGGGQGGLAVVYPINGLDLTAPPPPLLGLSPLSSTRGCCCLQARGGGVTGDRPSGLLDRHRSVRGVRAYGS